MRKVFIYLFLIFLIVNISFGYKGYNSSLSNLSLDYNGWCKDKEITFNVYNETEYLDRKNIRSNLCGVNETPAKNNCEIFQILQPDVKIYDGPFTSSPLILDSKANTSSQFKTIFTKTGPHLIELTGLSNFNDYYEPLIEISKCGIYDSQTTTPEKTPELNIKKYNTTLSINGLKLDLKDSILNSSENFTVRNALTFKELNTIEINNSINNFEILSNSNDFSNLKITVPISFKNKSNLNLFRYNNVTKKWDEILTFVVSDNNIILNSASLGIYSVVENKPLVKEVVTVQESIPKSNSVLDENSTSPILSSTSNIDSSSSLNLKYYIFISILVIIFASGIYYFRNKNKVKKIDSHQDLNEHIKNQEVLNTYEQILNHTKEYVRKYKNSYDKDQIYRVLKQANVPTDVIDKVFKEEYK